MDIAWFVRVAEWGQVIVLPERVRQGRPTAGGGCRLGRSISLVWWAPKGSSLGSGDLIMWMAMVKSREKCGVFRKCRDSIQLSGGLPRIVLGWGGAAVGLARMWRGNTGSAHRKVLRRGQEVPSLTGKGHRQGATKKRSATKTDNSLKNHLWNQSSGKAHLISRKVRRVSWGGKGTTTRLVWT